ncbi:MAG: hypothetical protein CMO01_14270 [Thalassobius sp.]|nr:hypothetical protein [Thalassovita sp.]
MKFPKKFTTINIILAVSLVLIAAGYIFYRYPILGDDTIIINVDDDSGNFFVSKENVKEIIDSLKLDNPSRRVSNMQLKMIEKALEQQDFILDAQVSRDLKGNIIIDIAQEQPIARLMGNNGKGAYINKEKKIIELSDNFSARVMVISGEGADSLMSPGFMDSKVGQDFYDFIDYIKADEFWNPQVAMLDVDKDFEVTIYPQVGQHLFEFGYFGNFEKKFNKMKIFYNEIIPKKGWGAYRLVKVQYNGQIVCR